MGMNWKSLHRRSLQENQPRLFRTLVRTGGLDQHLEQIEKEASEMYEHLVSQDSVKNPELTPGQIRKRAEDAVLRELILVMDDETLQAERQGGYLD